MYASIDEGAVLHEKMHWLALPERLGIESSLFYIPWTLPALFIIFILFLILVKFWWSLPNRTKWLLAVSVVVFLGGAVGMEMVSSSFLSIDPTSQISSMMYKVTLVAIEEGLEQLGVLLLIFTLLDYAGRQKTEIAAVIISKQIEV